jgi:hypothetical protein
MANYVVTSDGLNLRSQPRVAQGNVLAVLPHATLVEVLDKSGSSWWRVKAALRGATFEGYVASKHLKSAGAFHPDLATPVGRVPPAVHFGENNPAVTRVAPAGPRPLGEPTMPRAGAALDRAFFYRFIDWAAVDNNAHKRWRPGNNRTYCNIYAYDFAYAAGVYLPRVWWKPDAIKKFAQGQTVAVAYGGTVREMNANSLHDWLLDHGADHGWKRVTSLDEIQAAANRNEFCVICAARKDPNRSGHITIVVPEHGNDKAARGAMGNVIRPLQSQAGSTNFRLGTGNRAWWAGNEMRSFVLFRNPRA